MVSPGRRWCPEEECLGATPRPRPGRPAGLSLAGGARELGGVALSQGAESGGTPVGRWSREPMLSADIHGAVETRPLSSAAQLRLLLVSYTVLLRQDGSVALSRVHCETSGRKVLPHRRR